MTTYAMKDAVNVVLISKKTKKPFLKADYANETTTEWQSERVFATKKGANAVAWDSARQGTFKLNSELFDLKLLAMAMGSELSTTGTSKLFHSEIITIPESGDPVVALENKVQDGTLSVFKLKDDLLEHDGDEVPAQITGDAASVPQLVENVAITANDTSTKLTWKSAAGATSYIVLRDGAKVGQPSGASYVDEGLTAEKEYTYTVLGLNSFGQGPASAEVKITTAADGSVEQGATVNATEEAIRAAKEAADALSGVGGLNYVLSDSQQLKFSKGAVPGDNFVAYYASEHDGLASITVEADKFSDAFEIYGEGRLRDQENGQDHWMQVYFPNARPQSNFTFTQSAKEPTTVEITFDLMPDKKNAMARYTFID